MKWKSVSLCYQQASRVPTVNTWLNQKMSWQMSKTTTLVSCKMARKWLENSVYACHFVLSTVTLQTFALKTFLWLLPNTVPPWVRLHGNSSNKRVLHIPAKLAPRASLTAPKSERAKLYAVSPIPLQMFISVRVRWTPDASLQCLFPGVHTGFITVSINVLVFHKLVKNTLCLRQLSTVQQQNSDTKPFGSQSNQLQCLRCISKMKPTKNICPTKRTRYNEAVDALDANTFYKRSLCKKANANMHFKSVENASWTRRLEMQFTAVCEVRLHQA